MSEEHVGYGRPPKAGRFQKGRSGNPRGRPKGSRKVRPYDEVFGRTVTIRENGAPRTVTAAEAFLLTLMKRALEKGGPAAAVFNEIAEKRAAARGEEPEGEEIRTVVYLPIVPGGVGNAAQTLGLGTKVDRYSEDVRLLLHPWIVEEALARLDRELTPEEQREIYANTRRPQTVRWPGWWSVFEM